VVNSSLNPVLLTLLLPVPIPSLPLLLQETALLGEIWKDVKRTHNSYSFFSRERDPTIADTLERILFIFATLNAGVRYVQGMNEVLAPVRKGTVVWLRGVWGTGCGSYISCWGVSLLFGVNKVFNEVLYIDVGCTVSVVLSDP
jgi:hypothetical protein